MVRKSGEGMKVEKDVFLIDGGKSAMMTRLELRQPEKHGCQQQTA